MKTVHKIDFLAGKSLLEKFSLAQVPRTKTSVLSVRISLLTAMRLYAIDPLDTRKAVIARAKSSS